MSDLDRPEPDRRGTAPHPRHTVHLYGQHEAEDRFLAASQSGRMHHAWMITGPTGTGKATLAWRIARHVLSGTFASDLEIGPDDPVFRQTASLTAPGLYLCRRPWDPKTEKLRTQVTVEEIRQLKSYFQVTSADGGWRVAIVDSIDEFSPASANALLKLLEEPPEKTLFLIVCHRPATVLPTVRSRCRELACRPLNDQDIALALAQAGADMGGADARALAVLSNGSVGDAWDVLAHDGRRIYDEVLEILDTAPRLNRERISRFSKSCSASATPERFQLVYRMLGLVFFRLALAGAGATPDPVSAMEQRVIDKFGLTTTQSRIWAEAAPEIRTRAEIARRLNLDPEQVIFDTFVQIEATANRSLQQKT